ncbi:MAG: ATP-binding protein [Bdellovibrionales bacterium]|nr:ATP-binding protein [Bdellovibrionales bacterium]
MSHPNKIVLTGGPGCGKTKVAAHLKKCLNHRLKVLPESAFILYSGGFPRFSDEDSRKVQQKAIFSVQKSMETLFEMNYQEHTIICDRGTMDGVAYWPGTSEEFFKTMETSRETELARYDLVLFLQTPKQKHYEKLGLRRESYDQALDLEKKVFEAWSPHPKLNIIPSTETLEEKMDIATEFVCNLLGIE